MPRVPSSAFAFALVWLLAGCGGSGWGLPTSKSTDTPFHRFEGVKAAYDEVVPGVSRQQDLIALRFDPQRNSRGFQLPSRAILSIFLPRPGMTLDQQPPAIGRCLELRERCEVWDFQLERRQRHRLGNLFLDLLRFKRHSYHEGWRMRAIFLLVDGTVVYKTWSGTPSVRTHKLDVRPLGLAQHPFG